MNNMNKEELANEIRKATARPHMITVRVNDATYSYINDMCIKKLITPTAAVRNMLMEYIKLQGDKK